MQKITANSIIGNNTASNATPKALSKSDILSLLNVADGAKPGTVTSVDATGEKNGLTLTSNSSTTTPKITLGGTLTVSGTDFSTQTKNYVFAGPTVGGDSKPTFRKLVKDDIPTLDYLTNHQDITGKANLSGATFTGTVVVPTLQTGLTGTTT